MGMKVSLGCLLVGALALLAIDCCPRAYDFGNSPCTFDVNHNDIDCFNFNFYRCRWLKCVSRSGDSCSRYQWRYKWSWYSCTRQCCDDSVIYPQNRQGIRQCQSYLDQRFIRTLLLSIGIPVLFITLVLVVICCCSPQCCIPCKKCFKKDEGEQQRDSPEAVELSRMEQREDKKKSDLLSEVCTVCLENLPSFELECGHMFHRKCIIAWMRKKQECILCRSQRCNKVKAYCEQCFDSYIEVPFLANLEELDIHPQLCRKCKLAIHSD